MGFIGFSIEAAKGTSILMPKSKGLTGFTIEASTKKQFFEAKKGFKGFTIDGVLMRSSKIIRRT